MEVTRTKPGRRSRRGFKCHLIQNAHWRIDSCRIWALRNFQFLSARITLPSQLQLLDRKEISRMRSIRTFLQRNLPPMERGFFGQIHPIYPTRGIGLWNRRTGHLHPIQWFCDYDHPYTLGNVSLPFTFNLWWKLIPVLPPNGQTSFGTRSIGNKRRYVETYERRYLHFRRNHERSLICINKLRCASAHLNCFISPNCKPHP